MNQKELEKRLNDFSVDVMNWVIDLPKHPAINHLMDQIIRSSTAAALNYGEAQSAESKKDFIHKIGIVLKELRETFINLSIIERLEVCASDQKIKVLLKENDELLAIFHKTIMTARGRS